MRREGQVVGTDRADAYCLSLIATNPNLAVPHYLMHCYMYYVQDDPIISDGAFDEIVRTLASKWASIKHRHKRRLDRKLLKSGFHLKYPSKVPGAVHSLRERLTGGRA